MEGGKKTEVEVNITIEQFNKLVERYRKKTGRDPDLQTNQHICNFINQEFEHYLGATLQRPNLAQQVCPVTGARQSEEG